MFLLVVSFRISMFTKWKIYSIRFKLGLWGGIQNTKAPISSYSVLAASEFSMDTHLGESTLLLGWHSFRTWKGNAHVLYSSLWHLITCQNTVLTELHPCCRLWLIWNGLVLHLPCSLGMWNQFVVPRWSASIYLLLKLWPGPLTYFYRQTPCRLSTSLSHAEFWS